VVEVGGGDAEVVDHQRLPEGLTRERGKTLRAPVILDLLAEALPDATIALAFTDRWELLAATLLSAQSTDVKVNEVTAVLFRELPGPEAVAAAPWHGSRR
jgi:endonuclease III